MLLGVRAVLAESYERIHRSNLVGMGVLPLQFQPGDTAAALGLTGRETYTVEGLAAGLSPRQSVTVVATRDVAAGGDGSERRFTAIARLDGPIDVECSTRAASCRPSSAASRPSPKRGAQVANAAMAIQAPRSTRKPPGEDRGLHRGGGITCSDA